MQTFVHRRLIATTVAHRHEAGAEWMKPYAGIDLDVDRGLHKKELEKRAVTAVLARLGFVAFEANCFDRPDVTVDFAAAGHSVRLACEVQSLQADDAAGGSKLREFRARWIDIIAAVFAQLRSDGTPIPYCVVDFRIASYDCLDGASNSSLVDELVVAGRHLSTVKRIDFPRSDMPALSARADHIRVLHADGDGVLWWPSHLKSGTVPNMDDAIINAIKTKGCLATSFDWRGAAEKWLLLVAHANGLTDVIGGAREVKLPEIQNYPFTLAVLWDLFSEDVWTVFPRFVVLCDGGRQERHPNLLPKALQPFATGGERYPTRPKSR